MKNILVVGAAGGSGSATVRALLQRGDRVHGTVLNDAELRAAEEQNPELASLSLLDLSRSEDLLAAMPSVLQKTGGCCQSNGNLSPVWRSEPKPICDQARTDRHSASAAERLCL